MARSALVYKRVFFPGWALAFRSLSHIPTGVCLWGSSPSWLMALKVVLLSSIGGYCRMSIMFTAFYRFPLVYRLSSSSHGNVSFLFRLVFSCCAFSLATIVYGIRLWNPRGWRFSGFLLHWIKMDHS